MKCFLKAIVIVFLSVGFIAGINSCKKEETPTLTTSTVTNIKGTTATGGGTITDEGTGTVITRGVCWNTSQNPTISNSKTSDGSGTGTFTSKMTGLKAGTKYYVRAYATNDAGDAYGNEINFTTSRVTCSAGCEEMTWGISGESFESIQYTNWSCTYTYVGSSYIKSCSGTLTLLASGNSYFINLTYNWPACSITVDVEGVGSCSDEAGKSKSIKECDCGEQQVTEKFEHL